MPSIKIQSNEGEVFTVETEIAKKSGTIRNMLEDLGMEEDADNEEAVPLPNVSTNILKKVIQWSTHHKDEPTPVDDPDAQKRTDDISSWDLDFLKVDQGTLFELILAANYLDIKGLLDVGCKTVSNMLQVVFFYSWKWSRNETCSTLACQHGLEFILEQAYPSILSVPC